MIEKSRIFGIAVVCFLLLRARAESWEILDGKHDPRFALLNVTALGLNSDGVASKQEPKGDIAGGVAFPSEQFPPFDKTVVFKGIPFRLVEKEIKLRGGEAKRVNNKFGHGGLRSNYGKHYVRAPFIKPPPGYYSHLYILGCSEEDVWTEPKLNIMYGHRDYVQAKLSRWDAARTDARDEFPALQLKKMYRDGKLVRQKGTLWVKKIKLNPNVPGTSGRRFGIQIFPEIPLTFGTHVFAMTAERAPLYLKVEGFKHYHFEDQPLDLSVTVFNTTRTPKDAVLDIRLTHFFGDVIGKPIRLTVPPATMEKTDKGEEVKPGAITRSVPLRFRLRGHYWLDALLRDPSGEEISGIHERTFIHRRNFGIQSSIHVQPNSGPIGSPENELVKLFGAKDVDRNARSDYIQMTLGRCNGEAELTQHDPARYAHVIKEQYLKGQEKNPGARALIFGASGYSEDWWLKFIQNGGYDYIDAMWLEPVITPKAPESVSGFWKVGSSHDWMKLFQKYGHREVEARLNIQGRPHGDPGLGIFWADQGVSDKVTGKYAGRAIIMLAREAEHISLTDSWSRQYNARWWDAWGMTDAAGPFSRVAAAITCFAMLDRSKYVGQLELGDDIYCYLFLGENGPLMALWTTKVVPETVSLNVGAAQVRITDLMDNSRFERCADRTLAIELTDSPIFVEGFSRKLLGDVRQEPEIETLAPLKTTPVEKQVFIALDVNHRAHHRWQRVVNIQAGQESSLEFSLHVYNFSNERVQGVVDIIVPEGWKVTPQKLKVSIGPKAPEKLNEKGKPIPNPDRYRKTFPLRIHVPIDAKGDVYHLYAQASFQGRPTERVSLDNIRVHSPLRIHEGLTDPMSHNPLVEVTVRNPLKTDLAGTVKLVAEKAVTVQPASVQLKSLKPGEERRLQFRIRSKEPKPFHHYDVTAEATLNGTKVKRTETLDFFVIVPAPEAPKIDGMLNEWQEAYPFHLRYPNLEGGAPLSDRWMQDNYIYHFRKAGYQAKAWLMYDRDYLYMAFDVQDDWVTGELAAIYAYTGLLDHADEQMVVIDADSSGAVNLRPDGLAERSFVFMPRGPRESPYTGKFADPFPVFKECTHWLGLQGAPAPPSTYQHPVGGNFPADEIGYAVKVYDEDTPEHPKGYVMEMAFPMKGMGLDPKVDPTIQIWTLDSDRKMLYFYNWFKEPHNVKDSSGKVIRNNSIRGMRMKFVKGKTNANTAIVGDGPIRNILDGDLSWNRLKLDRNPGEFVKHTLKSKPETCGLVAALGKEIGFWHDPRSFDHEERAEAETVFFSGSGTLEYKFDRIKLPRKAEINRAVFLTEVCSEFPGREGFCYTHPSEITLWVNGKEVGSFIAPGDVVSGWLVAWDIRPDGCYINNLKVSDLTLKDIGIRRKTIEMKIGVKEDAKYKNGMNLYGDKNGKHGRDVTLLLYY